MTVGTTSADLAALLLDELERNDSSFVVLHGEGDLSAGRVGSDVDVAVSCDPRKVTVELSGALASDGVAPIMLWPYDRNSLTVFWSDASGDGGVQLDLVDDPEGRGRYGFCTGELIAHAVRGERWPKLDEVDELAYLIRKRQVKRNQAEVARLLRAVPAAQSEALRRRAGEAFSESAGLQLTTMVSTGSYVDPKGAAFDRRLRNVVANPGFYCSRITRSVGAWVSVGGATVNQIDAAVEPLSGLLPSVVVREGITASWLARAHTMRARLLITSDPSGVDGRADVGVDGNVDAAELRRAVVGGLAALVQRRGVER